MLPLFSKSSRNTTSLRAILHPVGGTRQLSIHEYQAQDLLAEYGVPVPRGSLATTGSEAGRDVARYGGQAVVKAQILAGGRGKGAFKNGLKGGVHVVSSAHEGEMVASRMLGQSLVTKQTTPQGLLVNKVYVAERLRVAQEYYLALTINRALCCPVVVLSEGGGMGIEELAKRDRTAIVNVPLSYSEGITDRVVSIVCQKLDIYGEERQRIGGILEKIYRLFKTRDATLVEINPLVREEGSGRLVCADAKISIDNAAAKRQKQIFELRDKSQEMEVELEAEKHGLVYVQLEGNIGCLVNGAGLAMATNDAVAHYGGSCANFLDGGGQATKETMVKAFELILSDKRVTTILVNIYGGIIKCNMIAESIISAAENFKDVPVVVRLQGTNSAQGQRMIANSGLKLYAEDEFGNAVQKAIQLAGRRCQVSDSQLANTTTTDAPTMVDQSSSTPRNISRQATREFSTTSYRANMDGKFAWSQCKRTFSSAAAHYAYADTVRNLKVGRQTKVIYQGFTGRAATQNATETIAYGTTIVGGVSPGKGGQQHLSMPVYDTVDEAARYLRPDATAVFVPALSAASAIIEAISAEIPLIVSVAEHVPVHDMLRVQEVLRTQSRSRLVGPNCPGIISPLHACRIGIMPHKQYSPGVVGIVSKSGTLSYEAVGATTRAGLGHSLCVGVGGDLLPGTTLVDALSIMVDDPDTKGIVCLGEIGGTAEMEAAEFLQAYRKRVGENEAKPVVGMVTGRAAPKGKTMGHAGAVSGGGDVEPDEKVRALQGAGVTIPTHPGDIGTIMKSLLEHKGMTV